MTTTRGAPAEPAIQDLATILTLEQTGTLHFRAPAANTESMRTFGGRVAGQALVAAGRTVPEDRGVHSLHSHFLRPGDSAQQLEYQVEPVRDGGSFSVRRVAALQGGEELFALTASFQVAEEGWSHQVPRLQGRDPESLPPGAADMAAAGGDNLAWFTRLTRKWPLDIRFDSVLTRLAALRGELVEPRHRFWLRSSDPLPDDPLVHAGAAAFASDVFLLSAALGPHGHFIGEPGLAFASLDHSVWFHRPFRADDWLHYDQESTWAGGGRALCRGLLFDRAGVLVASVMQEALIRRVDRSTP